ncbi:hypothetical protein N3K66_000186 [Trichothecium roseum]|uniref:Uncharacterized protein n=1 Tax=Trichothecium roseum TaxID=47278 RepID=A0ACC0VB39_9HYPO|nr:hypothetical protein N3K66_000186 [Trichothecium roseum]
MEAQPGTPRPHIVRLPLELTHMILANLSGLTSLRCAILSCRALCRSFMADPQIIATQVLFNELDACDVRPEAIAALAASELVEPTRMSVHGFCQAHFQDRNAESRLRLTLDQVAHLSRLHAAVSRLAEPLAISTLQGLALIIKGDDSLRSPCQVLAPSALELRRVMRTLYVLEAFYGLFDMTPIPEGEMSGSMRDFLLSFAHWEVEQMACVQEFLCAQEANDTLAGYNEIAAHDVRWGHLVVSRASWCGNGDVQKLYFKGLVALERLLAVMTYDEQYDLYDHTRVRRSRPCNLHLALEKFGRTAGGGDEEVNASDYENAREYSLRVRRPYFRDPDGGPFGMWKWANESAPNSRSVYCVDGSKLRKWGYTMWDLSRLDTLVACREACQLRTNFMPPCHLVAQLPGSGS